MRALLLLLLLANLLFAAWAYCVAPSRTIAGRATPSASVANEIRLLREASPPAAAGADGAAAPGELDVSGLACVSAGPYNLERAAAAGVVARLQGLGFAARLRESRGRGRGRGRLGGARTRPARAHLPREHIRDRARRVLLSRIQSYIEANLGDPALSPCGIAAHHNISRRYLYRLFEGIGESVGDFIRRRRLERCRVALADPRQDVRGVSEIAFSWGFSDASHFSHTFSGIRHVTARVPAFSPALRLRRIITDQPRGLMLAS